MEDSPIDPAAEPEVSTAPVDSYPCPNCGAAVDGSAMSGPVLICPACGTQFFPPAPENTEEISEEEAAQARVEAEADAAELSGARIRQLSVLARTAYRTRSYYIIGAVACLGTAAEIISLVVKDIQARHHWGIQAIGGGFLTAGVLMGAFKFLRRAAETQREIQAHLHARQLEELEFAKREPDLSTLSDGSQHARNLEKMAAGGGRGDGERGRGGDEETGGQGDGETGRQGDGETGRQGDGETGRQGDKETERHGDMAPRVEETERGGEK